MLPLPFRAPTDRLRHAREDHAICLRLAASYRLRFARGEPELGELHAMVMDHARRLRCRFANLSHEAERLMPS